MKSTTNLSLVGVHKSVVETNVCGEPLVGWTGHRSGKKSEPVKYDLGDGWGQKGAPRSGTKLWGSG